MASKVAAAAVPAADGGKKPAGQNATYLEMVQMAIVSLKERSGSSRHAIKKYLVANYNFDGVSKASWLNHFNTAIRRGVEKGVLLQPKGTSGPIKIAKVVKPSRAKPAAAADKPEPKPKKADGKSKKISNLKTSTEKPKRAAAVEKPAADEPVAEKAEPAVAPPKPAAKSSSRKKAEPAAEKPVAEPVAAAAPKKAAAPRKGRATATKAAAEPAPVPAVETKTKSGRVSKRVGSPKPSAAVPTTTPRKSARKSAAA